ncbi:MAG TPA: YtxH domain-containing protein [Candidatus Udaeobacter sp.]|jgi:gas vesicle protein|nr:YtxH domain-containing protein [Candidatus Udaeobacter sp.]
MQNGTNDVGKGILMFGLGVIAGGVAALLLAPSSGVETRKKIGDMASKVGQRAKDTLQTTKNFIGDQQERLSSSIDAGRQAYSRESTTSIPAGSRPNGM